MYIEIAVFDYLNRRLLPNFWRHRLIRWLFRSQRLPKCPQFLPHPLYRLMCIDDLLVLLDESIELDATVRHLHLADTTSADTRVLEGLDDLPRAPHELLALAHLQVYAASSDHLLKIN